MHPSIAERNAAAARSKEALNEKMMRGKQGTLGLDADTMKTGSRIQHGGADYAKQARASHQNYLDSWGPRPEVGRERGIRRVGRDGSIDEYTD